MFGSIVSFITAEKILILAIEDIPTFVLVDLNKGITYNKTF